MFVFVLAVPALLVVLLGYVVGYGLWAWIGSWVDAAAGTSLAPWAETAGWGTGSLTLAVTVRLAVTFLRRRRASGGAGRTRPPSADGPA